MYGKSPTGASIDVFSKLAVASANPSLANKLEIDARTFESAIEPKVVREVTDREPDELVLVPATPSGAKMSRSTAVTTNTSLSSAFSCTSICASVKVLAADSATSPLIIMVSELFFSAMCCAKAM